MNTVKKQYEELYSILEANKNKKVSTILPQLVELMSKKASGSDVGSTFLKDDEGNTYAIYCYYHKKWELLSECEYGAKASNKATGLNTMCKEGVSKWSKQQRTKKAHEANLLERVTDGTLAIEDVAEAKQEILEQAQVIEPREDGHGVDTVEELA